MEVYKLNWMFCIENRLIHISRVESFEFYHMTARPALLTMNCLSSPLDLGSFSIFRNTHNILKFLKKLRQSNLKQRLIKTHKHPFILTFASV